MTLKRKNESIEKFKIRMAAYQKEYYAKPENKAAKAAYDKEYFARPEAKVIIAAYNKEWKRLQRLTNPTYMERKRKVHARRKRELGFNPLNNWFPGSDGHHIDIKNVIYIPKEINQNIQHKQTNNDQMKNINILAWSFMESSSY